MRYLVTLAAALAAWWLWGLPVAVLLTAFGCGVYAWAFLVHYSLVYLEPLPWGKVKVKVPHWFFEEYGRHLVGLSLFLACAGTLSVWAALAGPELPKRTVFHLALYLWGLWLMQSRYLLFLKARREDRQERAALLREEVEE